MPSHHQAEDIGMATQGDGAPTTISVEEAAERLGIGRGLAYDLARSGKLPVLRLGRRLRVPLGALQRMLDQAGTAERGAA
jgi:excisionase family DNA binding protein